MSGVPNVRISREVDGERVEGVTRPVFIRNGRDYYLTDLEICADGSIFCWEWVDLTGLKAKLASGWEAIPEHLRRYALGDMDSKDWPLRVLAAGIDAPIETYYQPGLEMVTEEMHQRALDYFAFGSGYWNAGRGKGRNWMGRLLELIRSEAAAQRASSPAQPAP